MKTDEEQKKYISELNAKVDDAMIWQFASRDANLQRQNVQNLNTLLAEIDLSKNKAIASSDEDFANLLLGFSCVVTSIQAEVKMWVLLKEGLPDQAWDQLILAQSSASSAPRAHRGFSHLIHHFERLETLEKLLFPPQVFLSAGLTVKNQICSICESEYGECDHIVGRPYWGDFCYIIAQGIEANHVAIVDDPADKKCRIVNFDDEGGVRNKMTWEIKSSMTPTDQSMDVLRAEAVVLTTGS